MKKLEGPIKSFGAAHGSRGGQLMDVKFDADDEDLIYSLPPFIAEGSTRTIKTSDGVYYHIVRHGPSPEGYVSSLLSNESYLKFGFLLAPTEGTVWCDGFRETPVNQAGALMVSLRSGNTHFRAARGAALYMVILIVDSETILSFVGDSPRDYEDPASRLLFGPRGEPYQLNAGFDLRAFQALAQVEGCSYRGGLKRLFLEAKALELAALSLEPFMKRPRETPRSVDPKTKRRMLDALDYLDSTAASPPTLSALAREIGVSVSTLKRGFNRVHGFSPHQYVARRRMEAAREMIGAGSSVKEAAICSGLKSENHFIDQFRRLFGETPGHYARKRRLTAESLESPLAGGRRS